MELNHGINGIYTHYKGQQYLVIGTATHSETLEELVIYIALYGASKVWVRPYTMFFENIIVDGIKQPRFRKGFWKGGL